MRYRYLDLRRPALSRNVIMRSAVLGSIRSYFEAHGISFGHFVLPPSFSPPRAVDFTEIETPILFKSTPEGAREFSVPTREPGYCYALAQSPQQVELLF